MQYVGRSNNIHWSPTSHWLCRILLGAKVVWNIRLKGDMFCLLEDAWIFPRYINAIAKRGWVEQLPQAGRVSGHGRPSALNGGWAPTAVAAAPAP